MRSKFIARGVLSLTTIFSSLAMAQQMSQIGGINIPANIKMVGTPNLGTAPINEAEDPKSAVITPVQSEVPPPKQAASAAQEKAAAEREVQDIGFREKDNANKPKNKISTGIEYYNQTTIEYYNQWGKKEEQDKIIKIYQK